jgi:hypothetical protein
MNSQDFNKLSKEEKKKVPFKQLPTGNKATIIIFLSTLVILLCIVVKSCAHHLPR